MAQKQKMINSLPLKFGLVRRFWRYLLEREVRKPMAGRLLAQIYCSASDGGRNLRSRVLMERSCGRPSRTALCIRWPFFWSSARFPLWERYAPPSVLCWSRKPIRFLDADWCSSFLMEGAIQGRVRHRRRSPTLRGLNLFMEQSDERLSFFNPPQFIYVHFFFFLKISLNTMESRIQPRLFFAGEVMVIFFSFFSFPGQKILIRMNFNWCQVLNVDGVTGGFNFQVNPVVIHLTSLIWGKYP